MAKVKYEYWLTEDGLTLLGGWARDGLTDEQISDKMGIDARTLYRWKNQHCQICQALKKGKEIVDLEVENALFKRAIGYSYNEDKYTAADIDQEEYYQMQQATVNEYKFNNPEASQEELDLVRLSVPKTKMVLVERKTKEVAPDVTAQIFWLKNRCPNKWRDKQEIKIDTSKSAWFKDDDG